MNDPQSQAQGLAQFGRHGDSMLMHVNPQEVQGLQSLAQANGTSLTTNPYTGQPEAFNFRSMLKTAAPIAAGFAFGPAAGAAMGMGATAGGIAAGALTGGAIAAFSDENMLQGALFGGLGGMGGAGLRGAAGAVGAAGQAVPGAAEQLTAQQIANKAALQQTTAGGIGAQTSIPAAQASKALSHNVAAPFHSTGASYAARIPPGGGGIPSWASGSGHQLTHYPQGGGGAMDALKTIGKNPGAVAKQWGGGNALAGYGKMAGTMAMPLMAGYEPPGLSETDIAATHAYDPTRRLDLESIDTGLRLLANGGDVGLGGGDFVAGNFAAGDFAGDDSFGEFAEVTQAGQFDDFNQFSDFANDPILQNEIANDPIFQNTNNFTPEVNQPLPPAGDTQSFTELTETFSPGRFIEGAGDGLSDSIRANIDGQQEARLSDGEFVVPADVVSGIGNGSSDAGSAKLFDMMSKIRKRRTGGTAQPESIRPSDMTI